jgi:hypothetical protein
VLLCSSFPFIVLFSLPAGSRELEMWHAITGGWGHSRIGIIVRLGSCIVCTILLCLSVTSVSSVSSELAIHLASMIGKRLSPVVQYDSRNPRSPRALSDSSSPPLARRSSPLYITAHSSSFPEISPLHVLCRDKLSLTLFLFNSPLAGVGRRAREARKVSAFRSSIQSVASSGHESVMGPSLEEYDIP